MRGLLASAITVAALTSLAAPANAQQQQQQRQTAQPASWTGGQVGGFGGVSTLGGNFSEPGAHFCALGFAAVTASGTSFACPEVPFSFSGGSPTVATGGVFAGYSIPWGRSIVGIEADIAAKHGSTSSIQANTHAATGGVTTEAFTGGLSQGWDASIRARVGMPVNYSRTLLYATGGVAFGHVSGSFGYAATFGPCPLVPSPVSPGVFVPGVCPTAGGGAGSWSDTRVGYTVGGGAEWMYTRNIRLRVEYRYTDFGSFSKDVPLAVSTGACTAGGCLPAGNAHIDMRAYFHTVRFGIGFGF
jgi:outer membrane immunogenic protein